MIERELADLLQKLQAAHEEAAQNDSFWTPAAIAFYWNHRRVAVNRYSPEQREAYKQVLLTELAEVGSAKAWVEKLMAERRPSVGPQTDLSPESVLPTAPTPDPVSEEPPSSTQAEIDYASRARVLLGEESPR